MKRGFEKNLVSKYREKLRRATANQTFTLSLSLYLLYIRLLHIHMHGRTHFLAFFLSSIPIVVRSFEPRVKLNIVQAATNEASPSYWLKGARINAATRRKHLRVYAFFFFPPTIEKKTSIFSETDRIDASTIIFKADGIYIYKCNFSFKGVVPLQVTRCQPSNIYFYT